MRRINSILAAILLAVVLSGSAVAAGAVAVTDMAGRTVLSPFDPQRIVCLGPGALRLIVYLQATEKVVGVESMEKMRPIGRPYWIARPELHRLPACGPGGPAAINKKPDLEAVLKLAPEVIFVTYMDGALAQEVQRTLAIPVVALSYGNLATFDTAVFTALRIGGAILNRQARAEALIADVEARRRDLSARTGEIAPDRRPAVFVGGIGYRGAHGIESTEQRYIPFDWVHAANVAERVEASIGSHVFMDKEALLHLDPEVIFIDGGGLDLVAADFRKHSAYYPALKAFTTRRVYTLLPFNYYTTNVGTALADAYTIGKILYPDQFTDVDPAAKADEIYTFLVGAPVYRQMAADFGPIGQVAPFLVESAQSW